MRITKVDTFLVGNPWKNWLFTRVETDEGLHGVGEGTLNAFSATVEAAIRELSDCYIGVDPHQVERLRQRMVRDVYTDGGQIHMAAVAAIEVACWDIVGKATGQPVFELLGGRVRDQVRAYANGWYQVDRTPEAFAAAARSVVSKGYTALKFDPFGAAHRVLDRREEDLSIDIVAAVRDAVGSGVDLMVEGHSRFAVGTAISIAQRLADHSVAWFEEPVPHHNIRAFVEVSRRSPVPIATGENFTSVHQFADLLAHEAVAVVQPEPLFLGGLWPTRMVAAMAEAHHTVVAPHNAQGPVCTATSAQLGACIPNFYVQESFDEFNVDWTRELIDLPYEVVDGFITVADRPGLGIDLDWEALAGHPYRQENRIALFESGWEKRRSEE